MNSHLFVAVSKQKEKEIGAICSRLGYSVSFDWKGNLAAPIAFILPPMEMKLAWKVIRETYPSPLLLVIGKGEGDSSASLRPFAQGYLDDSRVGLSDVESWMAKFTEREGLSFSVRFESFGYKYGVPEDADLILDCRNVPNPYWVEELRPFTGLDAPIVSFLNEKEEVQ